MSAKDDQTVRDAVRGHWADRWIPPGLRPYARLARLERPIGWWLLLWPCWWSAALAAHATGAAFPNIAHMALFLIGAVAMRGAGCTFNDIVDRDIDAQVARTRSRPIPSGHVSVERAWAFLVLLLLVGAVVLFQFNTTTILMGLLSLVVVAVYPFMKRVMNWPQVVLGIAFSWGAFLGWTATFDSLGWPPVLLYAGGILWTIGYDTIYAHQDYEDDSLIGVRSTARLFGAQTKRLLTVFYGAAVILFAAALLSTGVGPIGLLGLAGGAVHLGWQIWTLDTGDPDGCLVRFRSNRDFGWIVFAAIIADSAVRLLV
ncbi:MAG: 4-hydroxybenzoate octaprenyltransferase [Alphaproteobacteria bacterium]